MFISQNDDDDDDGHKRWEETFRSDRYVDGIDGYVYGDAFMGMYLSPISFFFSKILFVYF